MISAWYDAYLTGIAVNDPKKFPEAPEKMWKKSSGDTLLSPDQLVSMAKKRKADQELKERVEAIRKKRSLKKKQKGR